MFDLSYLNPQQYKAVVTTEGAVLVVAGAGTGKTNVLTSRIANIVLSDLCSIDEILAVTFTNKAAREMTQRAVKLLFENNYRVPNSHELWIGTFHSIALRIIRPLYEKFNRTPGFTVIDTSDQIHIIKQILKQSGFNIDRYNPKNILYYISKWKDQSCSIKEISKSISTEFEKVASCIYDSYEANLKSLDVIDFSDILRYSLEIFQFDNDILSYYQNRFKYIMVDEYQDTNVLQYSWLKLLATQHKNLCCVGDDDQAIYGWRGADVENILKFQEDFKKVKVIKLEQNYRSTGNILKAANGVISYNTLRIHKSFYTNTENGLPIMVTHATDPLDEAQIIANIIEMKHRRGYGYNDFSVLVRTASQTKTFEDEFMVLNIPYILSGGIRFYDRKEIKDIIAYLKLLINPNDRTSFERVINIPKRGIGLATINKLYTISDSKNIMLSKASEILGNERILEFFTLLEKWKTAMSKCALPALVSRIVTESEYYTILKNQELIGHGDKMHVESKLEILDNLMFALTQYNSVQSFLDYVSLGEDTSNPKYQDSVNITTIHAAKGLEYKTVFIPGLEDGILPHQRSIEEGRKGIEEERRLFYVALTRAKKEVFITICDNRMLFQNATSLGKAVHTKVSRFLENVPHECLTRF